MSLVIDSVDARMSGLRAEISSLKEKWMEITDPEIEEAYERIIERKEAQYEVLDALWNDLKVAEIVSPRSDLESVIGSLPKIPSLREGGSDE